MLVRWGRKAEVGKVWKSVTISV